MPVYRNSAGNTVTADEAMIGGKLRPGYTSVVQDGEWIGFEAALMDAAAKGSVFLTDSDPACSVIVAQMRMQHDQKFSFLGDGAPQFDEAAARLIATSRVNSGGAAVRDYAREFDASGVAIARTAMVEDLHNAGRTVADSNASVRDLARAASYS